VQDRGPAAYLAEFIGTFALVFFITTAVSIHVVGDFADFAVIGLVHVFVLFFLIQTLALVSGAHFNPAVTVALTLLRQLKPADALIYILAQLAGGVAGALVTKLLMGEFANAEQVDYGAVSINDRLDGKVSLGMLGEFIGTFFLVWTIVGVAVNPRGDAAWAAFAIGVTLGLGVMAIGPLTGAGFNPARAFGPGLAADAFGGAGDFLLVYVLAPLLGAIAAAFVYFYVFISPGKKGPEGMEPVG
jgi:MIP family channel proteins